MNREANYCDMIFKRKSFHLFRNVGSDKTNPDELKKIEDAYKNFDSLYPEIRTAIRIVPASKVNFKRDAEYCILIYSEKRDNYLINAGYIGQQLDLFLVENDFGSLWYGIGKPDINNFDGMDFVIMIAVHKVTDQTKYRKDMFKSKRKPLEEIWEGEDLGIANISRFAPSACNSQPWYVKNKDGILTVYRYKKPGKRGIMPQAAVSFYNRIDIGIYLLILEVCLEKKKIGYERKLFVDTGTDDEFTKVAEYSLM